MESAKERLKAELEKQGFEVYENDSEVESPCNTTDCEYIKGAHSVHKKPDIANNRLIEVDQRIYYCKHCTHILDVIKEV